MRVASGTELRRRLIGAFIRQHRLKAGITQEDLANHLGYSSAQFVSNWERGVSMPPLKSLPGLAAHIGVSGRAMMELILAYQDEVRKLERKPLRALFKA